MILIIILHYYTIRNAHEKTLDCLYGCQKLIDQMNNLLISVTKISFSSDIIC